MRKLLFVFIILVGILSTGCHRDASSSGNLLTDIKHRGYVTIGVKYDSPPFGYLDADGQLKGLEIDLAHHLTQQLLGNPNAVHFVQVNGPTRIAALKAHQVDFVLATMTITPERAEVVNFSKPYYTAAGAIMVKSDSGLRTLDQLRDKTIVYVIGGTTEANLKKALPTAKTLGFKSHTDAFSAFQAGRGDAFTTDDAILYGFLKTHCGMKIISQRISEEPYGLAFRKDAASKPLQNEVQRLLDEAQKTGYLSEINHLHPDSAESAPCSSHIR